MCVFPQQTVGPGQLKLPLRQKPSLDNRALFSCPLPSVAEQRLGNVLQPPPPPSFSFSPHLSLPVGHCSQFCGRWFLFTPGQAAHQLLSSAQKLHWVQKLLVKDLERLLCPRCWAVGAEGTSGWQLIKESLPLPDCWSGCRGVVTSVH